MKLFLYFQTIKIALFEGGPPRNIHHVREWTFAEFQLYLISHGFQIIKSFDGVRVAFTQMHVIRIL